MKKILFLFLCILFTSCEQAITRNYGGNMVINLKPGEKLIEATWKNDADLWYLVEPMDSDYVPKTKVFKESPMFGILSGSVTFIESK